MALAAGNVALVTGAASGIGLAAAQRLFAMGLKVVLADRNAETLAQAAAALATSAPDRADELLAVPTNVAVRDELRSLHRAVQTRFGAVSVLMNNAGSGFNPGLPWQDSSSWKELLDINLWGIVHGVETFVPDMLANAAPGIVIHTGSKQGITSPPGNAAYNLSKAAVKSYTESLAHALRETCADRISVHLLIPGFTFTGMTGMAGKTDTAASATAAQKPAGAWTAEQVVDFMLQRIAAGDFYILCPDNQVDRATDERRIRWAADDIVLNRPALSRWHPDFKDAFAHYMSGA
jgi:NAD(P)-dependent dehydrogenase (short-subunit alcohol dehydrogenase family)